MKKIIFATILLFNSIILLPAQDLIFQGEKATAVKIKALGLKLALVAIPESELIAVQVKGLLRKHLAIEVFDKAKKSVYTTEINPGSTIAHIKTQTLYNGKYIVHLSDHRQTSEHEVLIYRE